MSDRIANRFEIVRCLGEGRLGKTYLCRQLDLEMQVVLKLADPELARDEMRSTQLRNAVVSCFALAHPHLVRGYEFLKHEALVAWTMEYVAGGDLSSQSRIEPRRCFEILLEIVEGLEALHAAGMVHQALKPQNVLFTSEGSVKLADFGMGEVFGRVGHSLDYAVPELLAGEPADCRSDVYGVGQLAYELITGRLPFEGATVEEARTRRLTGGFLAPKAMNPDCLESLNDIVVRSLKRDPSRRFQSVRELGEALRRSQSELFPLTPAPIVV